MPSAGLPSSWSGFCMHGCQTGTSHQLSLPCSSSLVICTMFCRVFSISGRILRWEGMSVVWQRLKALSCFSFFFKMICLEKAHFVLDLWLYKYMDIHVNINCIWTFKPLNFSFQYPFLKLSTMIITHSFNRFEAVFPPSPSRQHHCRVCKGPQTFPCKSQLCCL